MCVCVRGGGGGGGEGGGEIVCVCVWCIGLYSNHIYTGTDHKGMYTG